jgi:hypothetical protein
MGDDYLQCNGIHRRDQPTPVCTPALSGLLALNIDLALDPSRAPRHGLGQEASFSSLACLMATSLRGFIVASFSAAYLALRP